MHKLSPLGWAELTRINALIVQPPFRRNKLPDRRMTAGAERGE